MIDDFTALKQAMEQMDAEDPTVAQAAKDRAAQTLSDARLSFAKMADLIEQRQLLLQPRIVARIKRMDQPGMLGDSAFRDAGSALKKEGQSFGQIAEAIERSGRPAPPHEDMAQYSEPLQQMESERAAPAWLRALGLVARIVFFPLRHPIQFLAIALLAILLFYAFRGFVALGQQVSGYFDGAAAVRHSADEAAASVGSFVNKHILRQANEASPPTPPAPIPSPQAEAPSSPSARPSAAPATASAPPATAPSPSATAPGPSATASAPSATAPGPSATAPSPSATAPGPSATASAPSATAPGPSATAPAPPATAPPPPATAPAPSCASAPPAPPCRVPAHPSAAPAGPVVSTPRRDARGHPPSRSAANCCAARQDPYPRCCRYAPFEDNRLYAPPEDNRRYTPSEDNRSEDNRPRALEEVIPEGLRRSSRAAGSCVGGIGGCYWGGGRY